MDAYKTIVAHLDAGKRRAENLEVAVGLAEAFDAHLVGLYAPGEPRLRSPALAEGGAVFIEALASRAREEAARAEREFSAAASLRRGGKAEWRRDDGDALEAICLTARCADLLVLGQPDRSSQDPREQLLGFAADVVLSAGRPVLFVPYAGRFKAACSRVLVAWDAGREAARAVSDALPLLKRAQSVEVMAFNAPSRDDEEPVSTADIALYLSRHGVRASAAQHAGTGIDVGSEILSRAADLSAELIVMGGYGHSRVRELILGGATRTLLESMTAPVLMSH